MRVTAKARVEQEHALALIRRLGDLRAIASKLKRSRMTPLQQCEAIIERRFANRAVREFFADLPDDERHYWVASLYALLMPKARRKRLAAYFTPPHLAHHAIRVTIAARRGTSFWIERSSLIQWGPLAQPFSEHAVSRRRFAQFLSESHSGQALTSSTGAH
jgi:hypothetical protein